MRKDKSGLCPPPKKNSLPACGGLTNICCQTMQDSVIEGSSSCGRGSCATAEIICGHVPPLIAARSAESKLGCLRSTCDNCSPDHDASVCIDRVSRVGLRFLGPSNWHLDRLPNWENALTACTHRAILCHCRRPNLPKMTSQRHKSRCTSGPQLCHVGQTRQPGLRPPSFRLPIHHRTASKTVPQHAPPLFVTVFGVQSQALAGTRGLTPMAAQTRMTGCVALGVRSPTSLNSLSGTCQRADGCFDGPKTGDEGRDGGLPAPASIVPFQAAEYQSPQLSCLVCD